MNYIIYAECPFFKNLLLFYSYLYHFQLNRRVVAVLFFLLFSPSFVHAAYIPFNTSVTGNIGVGTATPQAGFVVTNGNVGIGTWTAAQALDVQGNVRSNGQIVNGNVGIGTSSTQANLAVLGNVGIGTWTAENGKLIVMGGNVGIGTNVPSVAFTVGSGNVPQHVSSAGAYFAHDVEVQGTLYADLSVIGGEVFAGDLNMNGYYINALPGAGGNGNVLIHGGTGADTADFVVASNSYVGVGTTTPASRLTVNGGTAIGSSYLSTVAPTNGLMVQGNVGIGSTAPGQALDVTGTVRAIGFTMSGTSPISGYVLTATDSSGDASWATPGTVGGWTTSGNNVYETSGGSVGIGTTFVGGAGEGALTVMNGNVGIGTWIPVGALQILSGNHEIYSDPTNFSWNAPSFRVGNGSSGIWGGSLDITSNEGVFWSTLTNNANTNDVGIQRGAAGSIYVSNGSSGYGNLGIGTTLTGGTAELAVVGGNVGIGTTTPQGALIVTNGNVGIGTWTPDQSLNVKGIIHLSDTSSSSYLQNDDTWGTKWQFASTSDVVSMDQTTTSWMFNIHFNGVTKFRFNSDKSGSINGPIMDLQTNGYALFYGNVGIGSLNPGQALDVTGTVRTIGFAMSGTSPISGYVLTATDSAGDASWATPGTVGGWTTSGNNVYETSGGNVGIGTSLVTTSALTVMNGNVGIGTWVPGYALQVNGQIMTPQSTTGGGGYLFPALSEASMGIMSAAGGNDIFIEPYYDTIIGPANASGRLRPSNDNSTGLGTLGQRWANLYVGTGASSFAGTVGIGTSIPINKLDINGAEAIGSSYAGIQTAPPNGLIVQGNVGINTFVPWSGLTVIGPATQPSLTHQTTATANWAYGTTASVDLSLFISSVSPFTSSFQSRNAAADGAAYPMALNPLGGNVGIGTFYPISKLDVSGGATFGSGYVANLAPNNGLSVQGNVGISTITASNQLVVNGAVSIGTANSTYVTTVAPAGGLIVQGNVGFGSANPGQALDVTGTVRSVGFTMSGTSPISGYVLTATDSAGDASWATPGTVGGWTTSGNNVYETSGGNVGIGTTLLTTAALTVMNGNVGIGTWVPSAPLHISANTSSNLGSIDLQPSTGNSSTAGFNISWLNNNGGLSVAQITGLNDSTWSAQLRFSTLDVNSHNLTERMRIDGSGNIGIGTTITSNAGLSIMNGNVGIGTWIPARPLEISSASSPYLRISSPTTAYGYLELYGGVQGVNHPTINTSTGWAILGLGAGNTTYLNLSSNSYFTNTNVGIGSLAPSQALDVTGTVRSVGFTMSGTSPISGYVLTATDSAGDASWATPGTVGGWTTSGNNVYETSGGNVGIGTTLLTTAALTVMNGNVGIGTWVPNSPLQINGNESVNGQVQFIQTLGGSVASIRNVSGTDLTLRSNSVDTVTVTNGSVGIGTSTPQGGLVVTNGNVGIGTWAPTAALTLFANSPVATTFESASNMFDITTGINRQSLYMSYDSTANVGFIEASQSGSPEPLLLNPRGGNVGIGTFSLNSALTVSGSESIGSGYTTNPALTNGLAVQGNIGVGTFRPYSNIETINSGLWSNTETAGNGLQTSSGHTTGTDYTLYMGADATNGLAYIQSVNWGTAASNLVLNARGGNVGIGTFVPNSKLTVAGGESIGSTYASITAPTNGLMVQSNVGIGTWSPSGTLDVRGSANTTISVKIQMVGRILKLVKRILLEQVLLKIIIL